MSRRSAHLALVPFWFMALIGVTTVFTPWTSWYPTLPVPAQWFIVACWLCTLVAFLVEWAKALRAKWNGQ